MDGLTITQFVLEAAREAKFDKVTMRRIEELALPEIQDFSPGEIKNIRLSQKISRSVWARMLNVGVTTVQKWESGKTHPDGAALKLLNLVQKRGINCLI